MRTRILTVLSLLLAATSVFAAKKDKTAEEKPIYAIKSGIIITNTNMAEMRERFENVDTAAMRERFGGMGGQMGGNFNSEEMRQRFANRPGMDSTMMAGFGGMGDFQFDENAENITMVYFDDYGAKQATVSKMGNRTTRTITDTDGGTITINEEQKTATKMPSFGGTRGGRGGFGGGMMMGGFGGMGGAQSAPVNFNDLTDKVIKKNKVQELGTEVIAGKECTIYSVRTTMMQQYVTNKYWVYKGIVLQSESAGFMDDEPILTTVTELQECEVPADIFTVPAGIKVTERDFGGMGGMMMMGGGDFGGGMGGGMGGFGGGMGGGFGGGMF